MCGYHLGSTGHHLVTVENLLEQTRWTIRRVDTRIYHTLVFTSNGSFLDPTEVPDFLRPQLLKMLYDAGFRFVVVETRPEFVTFERLDAIQAVVPSRDQKHGMQPLSISFGIESCSDFILSTCINKGMRTRDLARCAQLICGKGFFFDGYVLLGKPFLSAREDVEDALETIRWASELGADYLFVMVTNRVPHSLTDHLIVRYRQSLPSLWRAVRLLEMLPLRLRKLVQVKGISHAPYPPMEYATTCPKCRHHVVQGINFWNQTGDFEHIRELPDCSCKKRFETEEWTQCPDSPLPNRVYNHYSDLADDFGLSRSKVPSLATLDEMWKGSRH